MAPDSGPSHHLAIERHGPLETVDRGLHIPLIQQASHLDKVLG
jgi:hypothetical protein